MRVVSPRSMRAGLIVMVLCIHAVTIGASGGVAREAAGLPAADGFESVSFSTLSNFEYELPDPLDPAAKLDPNQVPPQIKALNGRQVAIRGFMLPLDLDQEGVREFMLNGSLDMCYFGAPVRMNEWVLVKMVGPKKARFTHMAVLVSGKLEVGEEVKNGRVLSLYRLTAVSAEVAQ
jgi:hypothetical protein